MAWSYRKNATHRNSKKDVRKAVCNKTKRKTKNEMAGWRVHGPEKDWNKRMESQSKGSRGLEAYCKGGQGPPRAVAPSNKKKKFSQKHNYKYMAKWWCLLAMEKLHVSAHSGHLQVLKTFLLKEFYVICHIFIFVFLTEFTLPYSLNTQRGWHTSERVVRLVTTRLDRIKLVDT